eukprot:TRINITY_DN24036_c0_g1_i1.p1 TRINITY_DN24036_c0_g1~~TRINITY_DN24036_c0_g1_i1.p1  ORF type:complete len:526 (-),score=83.12 TRINITY_DN24036_c0_g1_i1:628-2205(-)
MKRTEQTMKCPRGIFICVALGVILLFSGELRAVDASIREYSKGKFFPVGNSFLFYGGREGLYASSSSNDSKANSFIKFESITFKRTKKSASRHQEMEAITGVIEALVFEMKDRDKIGGSFSLGSTVLCCTSSLAKVEGCNQGEIIVHKSENQGWPQRRQIHFKGNDETAIMSPETIPIPKTGTYNLYFMFCDPLLKGTVVSGKTVWKNPQGYLPGRMVPLLKFYGLMSIAYVVLGLLWFFQYVRFWKYVLQLQNFITVIIALGMCQMATWYFEYANFNSVGFRPVSVTAWAVTIGAIKKSISHVFMLLVSMGYGVVWPIFSGLTFKVIFMGVLYFVAAEALDLFESVQNIDDLSTRTRLFLMLSVAILDALFILWIFFSLSKTLEKLQARRSYVKLELYRKFTNALAVGVVLSVAWIGYELYFRATDRFNERWQNAWIITAFWNLLTFILLCVICTLWVPSYSASKYSYSEEVGVEFEGDETVALTTGIVKSPLDVSMKVDWKDRKAIGTDVFSLGEDVEEGKRE